MDRSGARGGAVGMKEPKRELSEDVASQPADADEAGGLSRRTFLATATATVAALGLPPLAAVEPEAAAAKLPPGTSAPLPRRTLRRRRDAAAALRTERARHWKRLRTA